MKDNGYDIRWLAYTCVSSRFDRPPVYFFFLMLLRGVLAWDVTFPVPLALVSPTDASPCNSLLWGLAVLGMGFVVEGGEDGGGDDGGEALELPSADPGLGVWFLGLDEVGEEAWGETSSEGKTGGRGGGGRRLRASSGSS